MIPFDKCWPYERFRDDLFVSECPFCGSSHVLLPMKVSELDNVRSGSKRLLVFPCCHGKLRVVDADQDYLMTDTVLRKP